MARTWLRIKVDLLGGGGIECEPPPGRIFIVGPGHSFGDLAEAIDAAFARWDRSHLHGFDLADGRKIGSPDPDFFDALRTVLAPDEELSSEALAAFLHDRDLLGQEWARDGIEQLQRGCQFSSSSA